jgi:hypothetical protein
MGNCASKHGAMKGLSMFHSKSVHLACCNQAELRLVSDNVLKSIVPRDAIEPITLTPVKHFDY